MADDTGKTIQNLCEAVERAALDLEQRLQAGAQRSFKPHGPDCQCGGEVEEMFFTMAIGVVFLLRSTINHNPMTDLVVQTVATKVLADMSKAAKVAAKA